MSPLHSLQLLLQVFDAQFPMRSADRQVTVRDTQVSDLLLFLSRTLFPPIAASAEFPCLTSSTPFDVHHSYLDTKHPP